MKSAWLVLLCIVCLRVSVWYAGVDQPLPACARDQTLALTVVVEEARHQAGPPSRTILLARIMQAAVCPQMQQQRVRLAWYQPDHVVSVGDALSLEAKLKRPWGSLNEAGFNYRWWLLSQQIRATGYIRGSLQTVSQAELVNPGVPWPGIKQPQNQHPGIIRALALGDTSGVTRAEWDLFRDTGTIHLMVVSGLHVGILAGLAGGLLTLTSSPLARLFSRIPRRYLVLTAVCSVVIYYAGITGWQAPVTRASILCCLAALVFAMLRSAAPLSLLFSVALLSLLMFPAQVLQQGFWLSYGAVAALMIAFSHLRRPPSWVAGLVTCQLALFFVMLPLVGYIVGPAPILSPLTNLLVVPLLTLLTIPAAMLYVLLEASGVYTLASWLSWAAQTSMQLAKTALQLFPKFDIGYFSAMQLTLMLLCALLLTLPLSTSTRVAVLGAWLVCSINLPTRLLEGEFMVRTLDVGQGSAAVVDTRTHRLAVDVGPAFADSFDSVRDVLLPVLRRAGNKHLDGVLITHHDADHAGALPTLLARYPQVPQFSPQTNCPDGHSWRWDGVQFRLLRRAHQDRNAGSCTLLIDNGRRRAFFTGDIDQATELALLRKIPRQIDLLTVPHHGSRSSSHPAFVARLTPRWGVVSAGWQNRYGHPHAQVVARYRQAGAQVVATASYGQLTWYSASNAMFASRWRSGRAYLPLVREVDQVSQVRD